MKLCEELLKKEIGICCIQEVRWRGMGSKLLGSLGRRFKLWWFGNKNKIDGVGLLVREDLCINVMGINRISDRVMVVVIIFGISNLLQNRLLRLYGQVRRSSMCTKDVLELSLPGGRFRGRPAKTWLSCVEKDIESYGLENADPLKRAEWRKCISRLLYTPATGTPTAV